MLSDCEVAALLPLVGTTHPQPLPFREGSDLAGGLSWKLWSLFVGRATSTMLACCGQSTS